MTTATTTTATTTAAGRRPAAATSTAAARPRQLPPADRGGGRPPRWLPRPRRDRAGAAGCPPPWLAADPGTAGRGCDHGPRHRARPLGRAAAGRYRPSAPALRAFIAARDRTCGFPGCPRTATDCDCDHIENFDPGPGRGGKTVPANLGPLCRQHHNAKTHGHWQLHFHPDTAIKTWTSPLGKTYTEGTDPPLL